MNSELFNRHDSWHQVSSNTLHSSFIHDTEFCVYFVCEASVWNERWMFHQSWDQSVNRGRVFTSLSFICVDWVSCIFTQNAMQHVQIRCSCAVRFPSWRDSFLASGLKCDISERHPEDKSLSLSHECVNGKHLSTAIIISMTQSSHRNTRAYVCVCVCLCAYVRATCSFPIYSISSWV